MFKKLSLQIKITLLCMLVLSGSCVIITMLTMHQTKLGLEGVTSKAAVVMQEFVLTTDESNNSVTTIYDSPIPATKLDEIQQFHSLSEPVAVALTAVTSDAESQLNSQLISSMVLILVSGCATIYLIVRHLTQPLRTLSETVETMDEGTLSLRLEEGGIQEVADLSKSLNKMIQRLDSAFERQKRFAVDAAHELKTPLTSIQVNLDSLRQQEDFTLDEASEVLEVTQRNVQRLTQLAENLLQLNRTHQVKKKEKCSLHDVFTTILEELNPLIEQKQLHIELQENFLCVLADPVSLMRALYNCVENAVKYTETGKTIEITIEKTQRIEIKITNPSYSMTPQQCEDIFLPFYRAEESRNRKLGGSGLGLAIAQEMILNLDGTIDATCVEGLFQIHITL